MSAEPNTTRERGLPRLAVALTGKRVQVDSAGSWAHGRTGVVIGNLADDFITVELDGEGPRYAAEAHELRVIG